MHRLIKFHTLHLPPFSQLPDRGQDVSEDEEGELSEQALSALAASYGEEGGQEANDLFNDPAWWEAAVAELQNFESAFGSGGGKGLGGGEQGDVEAEVVQVVDGGEGEQQERRSVLSAIEEADGWVTLSTQGRKKKKEVVQGAPVVGAGSGGRAVVSGSVEDALRRPRLDQMLEEWADSDGEGEEGEEAEEMTKGRRSSGRSSVESATRSEAGQVHAGRVIGRGHARVVEDKGGIEKERPDEGGSDEEEADRQQPAVRRRRWATTNTGARASIARPGLRGSNR
jgi:hypothetical protein